MIDPRISSFVAPRCYKRAIEAAKNVAKAGTQEEPTQR